MRGSGLRGTFDPIESRPCSHSRPWRPTLAAEARQAAEALRTIAMAKVDRIHKLEASECSHIPPYPIGRLVRTSVSVSVRQFAHAGGGDGDGGGGGGGGGGGDGDGAAGRLRGPRWRLQLPLVVPLLPLWLVSIVRVIPLTIRYNVLNMVPDPMLKAAGGVGGRVKAGAGGGDFVLCLNAKITTAKRSVYARMFLTGLMQRLLICDVPANVFGAPGSPFHVVLETLLSRHAPKLSEDGVQICLAEQTSKPKHMSTRFQGMSVRALGF